MAAQWDIQKAFTDLQDRIDRRFDTVEERMQSEVVDRAELAARVKALEEKAGWIGAGIGASIVASLGLLVAFLKSKLGI